MREYVILFREWLFCAIIQKSYDMWEYTQVGSLKRARFFNMLEHIIRFIAALVEPKEKLEYYHLSPKIMKLADKLQLTIYEGE